MGEKGPNLDMTFPRDRRPGKIKGGWNVVGEGATKAFQSDLRPDGDFGPPDKHKQHDERTSPENYLPAIEIAQSFNPSIRRKRGEKRIPLAMKLSALAGTVLALYVAGKDSGSGGEKLKPEDPESKANIEVNIGKAPSDEGAKKWELPSSVNASGVNEAGESHVGDIDGGSPGGTTEAGISPEEAARNVHGDNTYQEQINSRQSEVPDLPIGNMDSDEYHHLVEEGGLDDK